MVRMAIAPWARRSAVLLAVLSVVALGPPAAAAPQPAEPRVRHVIIFSIDGARPDAARAVLPAALLARAAFSWEAQTTLPSSTLPAHTSMLTGVPTTVHGVRFNAWVPSRGHIRIPTVFSVVTANKGRAAAFVTKARLLYLVRPGTAARAEVLSYPQHDMVEVAREGARYLAQQQPHLLFLHAADPDAAGHADGWMSERYLRALQKLPEAIGVILDVLTRMGRLLDSLLIVTADHGGHGRTHGTDAPEDVLIPWIAFGAVEPGGLDGPIMTYDTAATAIAALGMAIPQAWTGRPVLRIVEPVR